MVKHDKLLNAVTRDYERSLENLTLLLKNETKREKTERTKMRFTENSTAHKIYEYQKRVQDLGKVIQKMKQGLTYRKAGWEEQ